MSACTPACSTPVPCPECGDDLPPRGRDVAMEVNLPACCGRHTYDAINTRHLWRAAEADEWPWNGSQPR